MEYNINLNEPIVIKKEWTPQEENAFLNAFCEVALGPKGDISTMDIYEDTAYLKYVILYRKHKYELKCEQKGVEPEDFKFTLRRLFLWASTMDHEDKKYFGALKSDTHEYVLNTLFRRYTAQDLIRAKTDVLTRLYVANDEYFADGLDAKWSQTVASEK